MPDLFVPSSAYFLLSSSGKGRCILFLIILHFIPHLFLPTSYRESSADQINNPKLLLFLPNDAASQDLKEREGNLDALAKPPKVPPKRPDFIR